MAWIFDSVSSTSECSGVERFFEVGELQQRFLYAWIRRAAVANNNAVSLSRLLRTICWLTLLLFDIERGRLAGLGRDGKAVEVAGLFGRLLGRDQPSCCRAAARSARSFFGRGVFHRVDLPAQYFVGDLHRALDELEAHQLLGAVFVLRARLRCRDRWRS